MTLLLNRMLTRKLGNLQQNIRRIATSTWWRTKTRRLETTWRSKTSLESSQATEMQWSWLFNIYIRRRMDTSKKLCTWQVTLQTGISHIWPVKGKGRQTLPCLQLLRYSWQQKSSSQFHLLLTEWSIYSPYSKETESRRKTLLIWRRKLSLRSSSTLTMLDQSFSLRDINDFLPLTRRQTKATSKSAILPVNSANTCNVTLNS